MKLAAWCLVHPAPSLRMLAGPGPGLNLATLDGFWGCHQLTWPDAPTDEVLTTFDRELADRHPSTAPTEGDEGLVIAGRDSVRLLTWGDPLLTA